MPHFLNGRGGTRPPHQSRSLLLRFFLGHAIPMTAERRSCRFDSGARLATGCWSKTMRFFLPRPKRFFVGCAYSHGMFTGAGAVLLYAAPTHPRQASRARRLNCIAVHNVRPPDQPPMFLDSPAQSDLFSNLGASRISQS